MTKLSLTIKTDDITSGRRNMDLYRQFKGVWVNRVFVPSFSETEAASEQTAEQAEIKETSPSPASEEEEPMDEN